MKTTLTTSQVVDLLLADKNANWSYEGAHALAGYLEEVEADTGEEIEFDSCSIRCDFSEYPSLEAWASEYFRDYKSDLDIEPDADAEETDEKIREFIRDHGQLREFDGGIIVSQF